MAGLLRAVSGLGVRSLEQLKARTQRASDGFHLRNFGHLLLQIASHSLL